MIERLIICEKPSQAKDIAAVLGVKNRAQNHIETAGGTVTWAIGHLLELAAPESYGERLAKWAMADLPIIPSPFRVDAKDSTKAQLKAVTSLIKKAKEVVVATDADREGEMIARELLDHVGFQGNIRRLWLSALDPESIKKALDRIRPGAETERLYHAALARSQSDWLVGMNMTRAATLSLRPPGQKGVLSVGRVQTPTLALVVRRDRAIEAFKPSDYFEIVAEVRAASGPTVMLRHAPRDEDRITSRPLAEQIAAGALGVVGPLQVSKERKSQAPPKLLALSDFQMKANASFGWSASKALEVAQSLYEKHKATTYPRTDCSFLPEEQAADVPTILRNLLALEAFAGTQVGAPVIRKTVFNTAKVTAHHAIIPTTVKADLGAMTPDEAKGFMLVAKSYLAALMPDYIFEQTRITMVAGVEFGTVGSVPISLGWKALYKSDTEKTDTLPAIADGTPGTVEKTSIEAKKTEPPARYTEGTLLADMKAIAKFVTDPVKKARLKETSGIGTEATRANIIATLLAREFVVAKGKHLLSTPKGRSLIALLEKHLPPLADPGETAVWEEGLEAIVAGKLTHTAFVEAIGTRLSKYIGLLGGAAQPQATEAKPTSSMYQGNPVNDAGTHWVFGAISLPKLLAKRPMSIADYVAVLDASPEHLPSFKGFRSKANKPFAAKLRFQPEKAGVEFVFENPA